VSISAAFARLSELAKGSNPLLVVLVGPNGAGKSTFYRRHLQGIKLPFINADLLARALVDAGAPVGEATERLAADLAERRRQEMMEKRASFITETVFPDPVGAKVDALPAAQSAGYAVVLIFVCVESAELSALRVQSRVLDGGHDVPRDKIAPRYERMRVNVKTALNFVDLAIVVDNSSLDHPLRPVASTALGQVVYLNPPLPWWAQDVLPSEPSKA
jgi:predicted ABC-type ATPase